jgi:hypothetical protein
MDVVREVRKFIKGKEKALQKAMVTPIWPGRMQVCAGKREMEGEGTTKSNGGPTWLDGSVGLERQESERVSFPCFNQWMKKDLVSGEEFGLRWWLRLGCDQYLCSCLRDNGGQIGPHLLVLITIYNSKG